jgi:hypothetical protein
MSIPSLKSHIDYSVMCWTRRAHGRGKKYTSEVKISHSKPMHRCEEDDDDDDDDKLDHKGRGFKGLD